MTTIERKIYTVDATDKVLGRLACDIARHLTGKHSTSFQPHLDVGDSVVVTGVAGMKVTGKKYDQKVYHHHTGFPGGIRTKTMRQLWEQDPALVLRAAVSRMLPKNKHRDERMKRLSIS